MRVKRCDYLTAAERLVFLALLEVANNVDCVVPDNMTPTVPTLAGWTHLGRTTVKRATNHLASHGWLVCEPGRGRGNRSTYALVPREPDPACQCLKGPQRTPLVVAKGSNETPKRVQIEQEKGPTGPEFLQVTTDIARRDSREEKGRGACKVFADGTCSGAASFLSCQLCPKSPTYWRNAS
jgi:hypothetical protein